MMELPGRGNGGGKAGVVTIDAFAMRNIAAWHAARGLPNPEAQQACARALRPLTNAGPCRHSINFSCDPNLTMDPVTAAHGAATPRLASASPFPHSGPLASLSASPLHTSLGDAAFPRAGATAASLPARAGIAFWALIARPASTAAGGRRRARGPP